MRPMINALSLLVVAICTSVASAQNAGTCQACNCQFNNVQVLSQLVASTVRDVLINEPGEKSYSAIGICYTRFSVYHMLDMVCTICILGED